MIAIFVPRDGKELKKYKAADDFNKLFSEKSFPKERVLVSDNVISNSSIDERATTEGNQTISIAALNHELRKKQDSGYTVKYHFCRLKDGGMTAIIEEMPDKESMVKQFNGEKFIQDKAEQYINIFMGVAKDITGVNVAAKDVVVFIHWGGGLPIKMEEGFRQNCQQCNCSELRLFSVSTRRSDKFNVKGIKIETPQTSKGIDILINKFMFDRVKDYLTEFVISKSMSFKFPEDVSLVKAYLSWVKEQYWTSMVFEREERKVWRDVLGKVSDNPCPVADETDFFDKVVHVYSRIIEEAVQNG